MGVQQGLRRLLGRETWWAEFWSACTTILWAALSYAEDSRLRHWPSMRVLLELGDDRFWHLLGFGVGLLQIVCLASDRRWLRWGAALTQGWFWAVLTVGVWAATPWSPAVAVHAGWCAINVLSVLRVPRAGAGRVIQCP